MTSQDSQTAAKSAADTVLCKMGCGFFALTGATGTSHMDGVYGVGWSVGIYQPESNGEDETMSSFLKSCSEYLALGVSLTFDEENVWPAKIRLNI